MSKMSEAKKRGRLVPITGTVPKPLKQQIERIAENDMKRPVAQVVRLALEEYVDRRNRKTA